MTIRKLLSLVLALAVLGTAALLFRGQSSHDILLTGVSAAPIEGRPGTLGVFMKIENGARPDRLVSVRSAVAGEAGFSEQVGAGGIPVPANATPALAPDGAFIQLSGLEGALDDGRLIPLTLEFEQAGEVSVKARLAAIKHEGEAHRFGLFGIGDICRVEEGEPAPRISVSAEAAGESWKVTVRTDAFEFSKEMADGPHVPGTGHGHLYLNGLKLQRLYSGDAVIGALPPGTHEITVTLNTNDHRAYVVDDVPVTARTRIIVD